MKPGRKFIAILLTLLASTAHARVAFLAAQRLHGINLLQSVHQNNGPHMHRQAAKLIVREDDGSETVLVDSGALDFGVCPDGDTLLVSIVAADNQSADIYRIDSWTGERELVQSDGNWNCQPTMDGEGNIVFLSDRDGWRGVGDNYTGRGSFAIYKMNGDGHEVRRLWNVGFGGVFGPFAAADGRVYFSTGENQGGRWGVGKNWGIWSINGDGGDFQPVVSAYMYPDRDNPWDWPIVFAAPNGEWMFGVIQYYNTSIFGVANATPLRFDALEAGQPTKFGTPLWRDDVAYEGAEAQTGFKLYGLRSITPWANAADQFNDVHTGYHAGRVSYPWPAVGGMTVTFTGTAQPFDQDLGIYFLGGLTQSSSDMVKLVDEPDRDEWMGKVLVPYSELFGIDKPLVVHTKKAPELPPASPFAVIGSSGLNYREWVQNVAIPTSANVRVDGNLDDFEYLQILAFNPSLQGGIYNEIENSYPGMYGKANRQGFNTPINELAGAFTKLIPLKKYRMPNGNVWYGPNPPAGSVLITRQDNLPDTSFQAEIPGNYSWTFQVLDANLEGIRTAKTWHQLIPGEHNTTCQGCHAHNQPDPVPFELTFAASPEYPRVRLDTVRRWIYERDIAPNVPGVPQQPWSLPQPIYALESAGQSYDNNPAWNDAQQKNVRQWMNTGMLSQGEGRYVSQPEGPVLLPVPADKGAFDDTADPTVAIERYQDSTHVGAFDADSGLESVEVKFNGVKVNDQFVFNAETFTAVGPPLFGPGDIDRDGDVDGNDFLATQLTGESSQIVRDHFGEHSTIEVLAIDKHGNETLLESDEVKPFDAPPAVGKPYSEDWNETAPPVTQPVLKRKLPPKRAPLPRKGRH